MAPGLVIVGAEVGRRIVDVRIEAGRVVDVVPATEGRAAPAPGDEVFDAAGGALLPGLHDHHIHLLALAAALRSVRVGPADVRGGDGFAETLRAADAALEPGRWLRAVGYHESVAGPLDRQVLDGIVPGRPLRVQHRGGAMWVVNSAGASALGLAPAAALNPAVPGGLGGGLAVGLAGRVSLRRRVGRRRAPDRAALRIGCVARAAGPPWSPSTSPTSDGPCWTSG